MAEIFLTQLTVGGSVQTFGPTTLGFLRIVPQTSQGPLPLGWGYELFFTSNGSDVLYPSIDVFPFQGDSGTSQFFPAVVRMPVTPGLPRLIAIRTSRQVGVVVSIFAGNETDYF